MKEDHGYEVETILKGQGDIPKTLVGFRGITTEYGRLWFVVYTEELSSTTHMRWTVWVQRGEDLTPLSSGPVR